MSEVENFTFASAELSGDGRMTHFADEKWSWLWTRQTRPNQFPGTPCMDNGLLRLRVSHPSVGRYGPIECLGADLTALAGSSEIFPVLFSVASASNDPPRNPRALKMFLLKTSRARFCGLCRTTRHFQVT